MPEKTNAPTVGTLFESQFAALKRTYADELPARISSLQAIATALASGGWDKALVKTLQQEIHRLAGSSGLYQMFELSRTAAMLDDILKRLLDARTWPPATSPGDLTTLVKAVRGAARAEVRLASPPRAGAVKGARTRRVTRPRAAGAGAKAGAATTPR